jgi:hypothetical protein
VQFFLAAIVLCFARHQACSFGSFVRGRRSAIAGGTGLAMSTFISVLSSLPLRTVSDPAALATSENRPISWPSMLMPNRAALIGVSLGMMNSSRLAMK